MGGFWNCSRRSFLALAAASLGGRSIGRLLAQGTPATLSRARSRRYAVHATVILGGIPLFTKSRVGGALLTIEESGAPDCGAVALQFGAGSWPDRLKGFNRFGLTQELVRFERGQISESSYISLMTACREANFSQAEQAFRSAADALRLTVACGESTTSGSKTALRHEAIPASLSWRDCPTLIDRFRPRLAPALEAVAQRTAAPVLPTFLYALRQCVLRAPRPASLLYMHNGETYCLTTDARRDIHSGNLVISGRTSRAGGGDETHFRLWLSDSEPDLPLRIEFRPKSYLKLTLIQDDTETLPVFKPMFDETPS